METTDGGFNMRGVMARANLAFFAGGHAHIRDGHRPRAAHPVPDDFIGICVASQPDRAADDYVLRCLRDLNIRHVRLDYTYSSEDSHAARLLNRLMDESYRVLLHLIQPIEEAHSMDQPAAQQRWRDFVVRVLDRYGSRVEMIEIGSTVNRRKWAGYTLDSFMIAWSIAREEIKRRHLTLAGPNVTDFEPVYNVGLLSAMQKRDLLPDAHTDNLFAERATEPETFDHKILGYALAPLVKFNLMKKARLLQMIAAHFGVNRNFSTHVAWSARRIRRVLVDVDEKQADYLSRYLVLAAASGSLDRVYWGPMIGQREGLVDDGTTEYPELPHVTLYATTYGQVSSWKDRPALPAMAAVQRWVSGARYERAWASGRGLEIHEFAKDGQRIHVAWTINARGASIHSLYDKAVLDGARYYSRDGKELASRPDTILERPIYLVWPDSEVVKVRAGAAAAKSVRFHGSSTWSYRQVTMGNWTGWTIIPADAAQVEDLRELDPDSLEAVPDRVMLRDARNAVWEAPHLWDSTRRMVVKRSQVNAWHKKILQRWKPSKAERSWNGSWELLRRGCATPRPIAFLEHRQQPSIRNSYFLCEKSSADGSVRKAFNAFAAGSDYQGMTAATFYTQLAEFLGEMHQRGVYFRDLSAGNVLVKMVDGQAAFELIDTARAWFDNQPVSLWRRISDLKRICHPLHWQGRDEFVGICLNQVGRSFSGLLKIPFALYDAKHAVKNFLKGRR